MTAIVGIWIVLIVGLYVVLDVLYRDNPNW